MPRVALTTILLFMSGCRDPDAPSATAEPPTAPPAVADPVDPEPAPVQPSSQDIAPLLGRWAVRQTERRVAGGSSEVLPPDDETTWELTADGRFLIRGGQHVDATYTLDGDRLVVHGQQPLDFTVDRVTETELHVHSVRTWQGVTVENHITLDRR